MKVFESSKYPHGWIVEDKNGKLWYVPAIPNGWEERTPFKGFKFTLREVPYYYIRGMGVPCK